VQTWGQFRQKIVFDSGLLDNTLYYFGGHLRQAPNPANSNTFNTSTANSYHSIKRQSPWLPRRNPLGLVERAPATASSRSDTGSYGTE